VRLAEAQTAIDAERVEVSGLIARQRALRTTLTADARAAQGRADRLGREARNLRDLAARVARAAPRPARAAGSSVIPATWRAPASGRVTRAFGAREGQQPPAQGATLALRGGAQVVAPAAGEIAYAAPFRGYGNVLIVNVQGGYALVLTGLDSLLVRAGESVGAGQPVGEMASRSDMTAPELYVEVRRDGRPMDPTAWLNASGARLASAQ
jgi:septal ring factor EnvC (AmiA/AmiB activator)